MAYTRTFALNLGASATGLTLKAALRDTAGTIHATLRDLTGFTEDGGGVYGWTSAAIPAGYRGRVVFYVGTLAAASTFSGVTVKGALAINPGEAEKIEAAVDADAKVTTSNPAVQRNVTITET